jgi:hypothetical protein
MALVEVDVSDLKDRVEPGSYVVTIVGDEVKTGQSGKQFIKWTAETCRESETKNNGRKITFNTFLNNDYKLAALVMAATGQPLKGNSLETGIILGKQVAIEMVDGVRDGQPTGYVEVKRIKSVNM